jgi:hypothetical protein
MVWTSALRHIAEHQALVGQRGGHQRQGGVLAPPITMSPEAGGRRGYECGPSGFPTV